MFFGSRWMASSKSLIALPYSFLPNQAKPRLQRRFARWRSEPNGFVEVLDRLVVVLLRIPHEAAIAEGDGELGIEANGRVVIVDRLVVVLLGIPRSPADVEGGGVLGIEPDSLAEVLDCLVVLLLRLPGDPTVVESFGKFGIKPDGRVVIVIALSYSFLACQTLPRPLKASANLGSRRIASS